VSLFSNLPLDHFIYFYTPNLTQISQTSVPEQRKHRFGVQSHAKKLAHFYSAIGISFIWHWYLFQSARLAFSHIIQYLAFVVANFLFLYAFCYEVETNFIPHLKAF